MGDDGGGGAEEERDWEEGEREREEGRGGEGGVKRGTRRGRLGEEEGGGMDFHQTRVHT